MKKNKYGIGRKARVAICGGSCTGKSTLAAAFFAYWKERGMDPDLITEESRKLKSEFGQCKNSFERLYLWRQQEREEVRSKSQFGFVTDSPLFQQFINGKYFAKSRREQLAVREMYRMCQEVDYDIIIIAKDANEITYRKDHSRTGSKKQSRGRHEMMSNFVKFMWPERVVEVSGKVSDRLKQLNRAYLAFAKK